MTLGTLYKDLINQIVSDLKTITPELANDTTVLGGPRVTKWKSSRSPRKGRYEAEVMAGKMEPLSGFTTRSSNNEFQILVDLIFYGSEFESAFDSVMGVAERIYDKFHLTNISSLVRVAKVTLEPGDGVLQRGLLAIPIRITIKCEKVITQ